MPNWEEMSVWSGAAGVGTESPLLRSGTILARWPVVQRQKGLFCALLLPSPSSHGRVLPRQLPLRNHAGYWVACCDLGTPCFRPMTGQRELGRYLSVPLATWRCGEQQSPGGESWLLSFFHHALRSSCIQKPCRSRKAEEEERNSK